MSTESPALAALAAVVRVLRRRDPMLAALVDDLGGAAGSAELHLSVPLLITEHGMAYARPEAVIKDFQDRLAAFERTALRAGPKRGVRQTADPLSVKVMTVEAEFGKMTLRNPRPTRETWELICHRLWRKLLGQTRKLPGYVVDVVVTGKTHRSRALHLVAASQGDHADPETLRRRIQRDPRAAAYRKMLRAVEAARVQGFAQALAQVRSSRRSTR